MTTESYGWSHRLLAAVANNGTVVIQTPGYDRGQVDEGNLALVLGGETLATNLYSAAWATDKSYVTITNLSGVSWPYNATLYVYCPGLDAKIFRADATYVPTPGMRFA